MVVVIRCNIYIIYTRSSVHRELRCTFKLLGSSCHFLKNYSKHSFFSPESVQYVIKSLCVISHVKL